MFWEIRESKLKSCRLQSTLKKTHQAAGLRMAGAFHQPGKGDASRHEKGLMRAELVREK